MTDDLFVLKKETDFQFRYLNFTDLKVSKHSLPFFFSLQFKPNNKQLNWKDMYAEKLSWLMILFFLTRESSTS